MTGRERAADPRDAGAVLEAILVRPVAAQLRCRRAAARRLPGGDPWPAGIRQEGLAPFSERQIEAWTEAVRHLTSDGMVPMVPVDVLREMWRRGGPERELAREIYESGGFVAA